MSTASKREVVKRGNLMVHCIDGIDVGWRRKCLAACRVVSARTLRVTVPLRLKARLPEEDADLS